MSSITSFYRGYVPTGGVDGKQPLIAFNSEKVPDNKLYSESEAKECESYAGVLHPGVVLVDFDNMEHAEIAKKIVSDNSLQVRMIQTNRGIHIYFKSSVDVRNKTKCNLACGLNADIKSGYHNSTGQLKLYNKERTILQDCNISELSELPFYFKPVTMSYIKKKVPDISSLYGMHSGDGRNEALFGYICDCLKSGIQPDDIRELFYIINNYVFGDPLDDSELDSITRKDAVKYYGQLYFFEKNKPLIRNITDFMEHKEHIIRINGELCIYTNKGIYSNDIKDIEKSIQGYFNNLNSYQRNEIIKILSLECPEKAFSDKRYISFANGVYDLKTDVLKPHTHEYIIPNQIPWNYDPENDSSAYIEQVIYQWCCMDDSIFNLIEEIIGYCMLRENNFRRFFIIVGNKRNGKSIFLKVLSALIGTDNCSFIPLEQLDTRFINSLLINKLVNIGDDIEDAKISHTATLKKLVSGDALTVERKGQQPISMNSYATLIFSANVVPDIKDATGAVKDRLIIIPFNNSFKGDNDKPNILDELITEDNMQYLIYAGIDGLKRLQENKAFTIPECVKQMMEQYTITSDPIASFIESISEDEIVMHPTVEVYQKYETFCKEHDLSPVNHRMFSRTINSKCGYKTDTRNINGIKTKVFLYSL